MKFSDTPIHRWGNEIDLAGVVYVDRSNARQYLIELPGENLRDNPELLKMEEGDWNKLIHQTDQLETEILAKAPDGTTVKIVLRKATRQIDVSVSWKVFRRDEYKCVYCGRDDVPLTVDHLVLWEDGGPSTEENLVSACKKCNKARGNMQFADWLESDRFKKVSAAIGTPGKSYLQSLIPTLTNIPRKLHVKSR